MDCLMDLNMHSAVIGYSMFQPLWPRCCENNFLGYKVKNKTKVRLGFRYDFHVKMSPDD